MNRQSSQQNYTSNLYQLFDGALRWNAIFFIAQKGSALLLTWLISKHTDASSFATWATLNSLLYLILLWTDFGLRKSLPRFLPLIARHQAHKQIITAIVLIAIICLLIGLPCYVYLAMRATEHLEAALLITPLLNVMGLLYLFEGAISLMRTFLYANWNIPQANSISTIASLLILFIDGYLIYIYQGNTLIVALSYGALCISFVHLIALLICGATLLAGKNTIKIEHIQPSQDFLDKPLIMFYKHSFMMWSNTLLKSLTERNILIPVVALTGGLNLVALFKIANDGALTMQRLVLKTLGSADTSLLTYAIEDAQHKPQTQVAFTYLATRVAALCFPLMGIIIVSSVLLPNYWYYHNGYQLFTILSLLYLTEVLLLVWERLLEVTRCYFLLCCAYAVYVIGLGLLVYYVPVTSIGIVFYAVLIGVVRLVSYLIMACMVVYTKAVVYPMVQILQLAGNALAVSIGLCLAANAIYIIYTLYIL